MRPKTKKDGRVEDIFRDPLDDSSELAHLLLPLDVRDFSSRFLGQNFYHFKSTDPNRFDRLFSYRDLSHVIAKGCSAHHTLAFSVDRKAVPIDQLTKKSNGQTILDASKVSNFLGSGGSLSIKHLDQLQNSVGSLTRDMTSWLGFDSAFTNLYYTQRGRQTFGWHQDGHDIFVFQVEGKKSWEIYAPHYRIPYSPTNPNEYLELGLKKKDSRLVKRLVLNKGDILYIPACFPHEVRCLNDDDSLHLTLGLIPYQRHQLLTLAFQKALKDSMTEAEFRAPLFPTADGALHPRERVLLATLLRKVVGKVNHESLNHQFACRRIQQSRPREVDEANILHDRLQNARSELKAGTMLIRTDLPCQFNRKSTSVQLVVSSGINEFELGAAAALEFAIKRKQLTLRELPGLKSMVARRELANALLDLGLYRRGE